MPEYCKINHKRKITESVLTSWWNNGSGDADSVIEHVIAMDSSMNSRHEMSWNNHSKILFSSRIIQFHSFFPGERRCSTREWQNCSGTVFLFLVNKEIVIECLKTHFCLIFMLLMKLESLFSYISKHHFKEWARFPVTKLFLYLSKWSSKWAQITSVT